MASQGSSFDVLDMLTADHRSVQKLFVQFDKEDDHGIRQDIVRTVCAELMIHATLEEELFYPRVQQVIKDPDLVDEATVEHASARQLIDQLERMTADDALFDATFKVLGDYINHHIEEEEETLFVELKRTKLDLQTMAAAMTERRLQLQEAIEQAAAAEPR